MQSRNEQSDVEKLAYELTYHRYLMNKSRTQNLFTELTIQEYIALHTITKASSGCEHPQGKMYLRDLSDAMRISIHIVSKMVGDLKERGLVIWSHDGDGSDGTYITITESGIASMNRQDKILDEYYSRVIEKFGHDNMISLLKEIDKLEKVMNDELSGKEDTEGQDDKTE